MSGYNVKLLVMLKTGVLLLVLLVVLSVNALAQTCANVNVVLPDSSRFDVNRDGTVTDIDSGLTWQRCLVGQKWNGETCTGEATTHTWQQAAKIPTRVGQGAARWRLPKIFELAAIVDLRCDSPRIDLAVFPHTQAKPHWTVNNVPDEWGQAYTLSFGHEGVARAHKAEKHYVRLVSGRD